MTYVSSDISSSGIGATASNASRMWLRRPSRQVLLVLVASILQVHASAETKLPNAADLSGEKVSWYSAGHWSLDEPRIANGMQDVPVEELTRDDAGQAFDDVSSQRDWDILAARRDNGKTSASESDRADDLFTFQGGQHFEHIFLNKAGYSNTCSSTSLQAHC